MIHLALILLLLSCADACARNREKPVKAEPIIDADLAPRKVQPLRIIEGENGKWIVVRDGINGIEDAYSRVPPFNRGER